MVGTAKAVKILIVELVIPLVFCLGVVFLGYHLLTVKTSQEVSKYDGKTGETQKVSPQPNIDGNYYPLQYTQEDLHYLTQALYFEVQGEPLACQEMAAHVIMTRVYDWHYPNTVKEVIWADKQFSYTHDGKHEAMDSEPNRYVAEVVAKQVLSGISLDTTEGSLYYFNPKLADPDWQHDYTFVKSCGNHVFYKRKEIRSWS